MLAALHLGMILGVGAGAGTGAGAGAGAGTAMATGGTCDLAGNWGGIGYAGSLFQIAQLYGNFDIIWDHI